MSNESSDVAIRAPLGFIVEGHSEYSVFPSLVTQITKSKGYRIPIVNARGFGGILGALEDHLDDLVKLYHPFNIIVTIDLHPLITGGQFQDCASLRTCLDKRAEDWLNAKSGQSIFSPLPRQIEVVIQIQSFETWMISDIVGLEQSGMFDLPEIEHWGNVDDEVANPYIWIKNHCSTPIDVKNPNTVKTLMGSLNIERMRSMSKSFCKFYREIAAEYRRWETELTAC